MKRTDTIRVAVVNHSTAISDENAAQGVAAIHKQISEDFGPVWNIQAELRFAGKERLRDSLPDHWGLVLVDDASQSRQLGYHDLTSTRTSRSEEHTSKLQSPNHLASRLLL